MRRAKKIPAGAGEGGMEEKMTFVELLYFIEALIIIVGYGYIIYHHYD